MPTDDILIRFKADTGQLKAEFDEIQAGLRKVATEEKKSGEQAKVTSKDIADAATRRNALLKAEINVLKQLGEQQKKAFTPKDIAEFNSKITDSKRNISLLKGEQDKLAGGNNLLGSSFAKLGGLIAAAFSVQQLIAFGNTAVTEFANAEKAAFQLLGALNGNQEAQQRLLNLADEFQERFKIDNDVIVAQESFLAIQGRTETQIRKTIQAAIQLSAAVGGTLEENVQKLDGTFEGITGKMGTLDSRITGLTKSQLANGAAIDIINEKYQGFAEKGLEGVSGELQRIQVESENAAERLGESIAPIKIFFQDAKKDILNFFSTIVDGIKSFVGSTGNSGDELQKFRAEQLALSLKAFEDFNVEKLERLQAADERELASSKNLTEKQKALIESEIAAIKQLILIKQQDADASRKASLPTDEELKAIKEKAAKEIEARKQAQEALRKFTLATLQDNITDEDTAAKLLAVNRITSARELAAELQRIDIETLEKRKALLVEFGESTADIEKATAEKKIAIAQKEAQDRADLQDQINEEQINAGDALLDAFIENEEKKREEIQKTLSEIQEAAGAFNDILSSITESQIASEEEAAQRQTDSLDRQQEHLEKLFDSHKISQEEFDKRSKALADSRVKTEKESQRRINELKRNEAVREKAMAVFTIGLEIAKALAALNFFQEAIAGAQLIAVLAKPLPAFEKGTKKKQGSGLARVGEKGEEIVFLPSGAKVLPAKQTREHADILDSMFDGNLDKFIHKNYVLPALKLQSPNVNINIDYKKLAKANQQRSSVSIDNLHELAEMFGESNPRRVI